MTIMNQPPLENLVDIKDHLIIAQHNPETGCCEFLGGVTAIDVENNVITYMHFEGDFPKNLQELKTHDPGKTKIEKRTRIGEIYLFIDKSKIMNLETLGLQGH